MQKPLLPNEIEGLFEELISFHHQKMMACGRRIIPHLTTDDALQPNDFPELENHPHFRYEEGILSGIETARMALRAFQKEKNREVK